MGNVHEPMGSSTEQKQSRPDKQSRIGSRGQACTTGKGAMMCFNPKVVLGLVGIAAVTWAVAPGLAAAALPILIVAACPLSMVLMMRGTKRAEGQGGSSGDGMQHTATARGDADRNLSVVNGRPAELAAEQEKLACEIRERQASEAAGDQPGVDAGR